MFFAQRKAIPSLGSPNVFLVAPITEATLREAPQVVRQVGLRAGRVANLGPAAACSAPDANASFDCFNFDFRCMARNVVCDQPLNTPGAKTNCHERADSYLEPVQKYIDFLSALRPSNRLFISGIWTLPALDHGGQMTIAPVGGASGSPALNRTSPSCGGDSTVTAGAPQLRLSKLAQKFKGSIKVNLCDKGNYPAALDNMATTMLLKAGLITQ